MTEQKIIIVAVVVAAVIVISAVVYIYRDKLKKALAEPGQTLLYLAGEWEEFISQDSTRQAIKALCRLADRIVTGDGTDRLAFVCGRLYELVPDYLQTVITIEKLQEIVNIVYEEIKIRLDDGRYVAGE